MEINYLRRIKQTAIAAIKEIGNFSSIIQNSWQQSLSPDYMILIMVKPTFCCYARWISIEWFKLFPNERIWMFVCLLATMCHMMLKSMRVRYKESRTCNFLRCSLAATKTKIQPSIQSGNAWPSRRRNNYHRRVMKTPRKRPLKAEINEMKIRRERKEKQTNKQTNRRQML